MKQWFVYILETAAGVMYTGISTDVERRIREHESSIRGAKSLRGKGPLSLLVQLPASDRSEAQKIEAGIKRLSRREKKEMIRMVKEDRSTFADYLTNRSMVS